MLNRVTIAGRMARDPELRRTNTGAAVASFTLAVDRNFKSQNGERLTDWIDCVVWKGTAEFVARYFRKGALAIVDGRLQVRDWTDLDGNKRRSYEVIAETVHFGGSKREGDGGYQSPGYSTSGGYTAPQDPGDGYSDLSDDDDGELPF